MHHDGACESTGMILAAEYTPSPLQLMLVTRSGMFPLTLSDLEKARESHGPRRRRGGPGGHWPGMLPLTEAGSGCQCRALRLA